jgi:hypothetical protein
VPRALRRRREIGAAVSGLGTRGSADAAAAHAAHAARGSLWRSRPS